MQVRQEVLDTYWYLAAERQEIFYKKLEGKAPPYTKDPILNSYKFCNAYRASDRVSQDLLRKVIYQQRFEAKNVVFRTIFFRLFNRTETWEKLEGQIGEISLKTFNREKYSNYLRELKKFGPIYGNAYIMCANKAFGMEAKHDNHLALLEKMFLKSKAADKLIEAKSLKHLFEELQSWPLIGDFMAYQLSIDLNYSEVFNFNENDFTKTGPGAARGILKMFPWATKKDYSKIIMTMTENQEKEFKRLGLNFKDLFGRKLHAIDCQNLFCETDKYCRVKFPELKSLRSKIKTKYSPSKISLNYFYPPKWGINENVTKFKKAISEGI